MANTVLQVPTLQEFRTMLRRHNLKATRQRLAVHEVMMDLVHASADMVREELEKRGGGNVTLGSVYNILSQLAESHIYIRRLSASNKMFFDVINSPHIHLYDRENNTYRDLVNDDLQDLVATHLRRRRFKGFTLEGVDIQFIARPSSRKTKNS